MSYEPKELLSALRNALDDAPLPTVVKLVADAFEGHGIRIAIAAIESGNPAPLVEIRVQQTDVAGVVLNSLGHKLASLLTRQARPRVRRGGMGQPPGPGSCRTRGPGR